MQKFLEKPLADFVQNEKNNSVHEIYDGIGAFCGFLQQDNEKVVLFDTIGKLSGFCISEKEGLFEKYNDLGHLEEYSFTGDDLIKYDKSGRYNGYFVVNQNGNISEYNSSGKYTGHYFDNNGTVIKFNELGKCEYYIR